jgi:hypothetical protein
LHVQAETTRLPAALPEFAGQAVHAEPALVPSPYLLAPQEQVWAPQSGGLAAAQFSDEMLSHVAVSEQVLLPLHAFMYLQSSLKIENAGPTLQAASMLP